MCNLFEFTRLLIKQEILSNTTSYAETHAEVIAQCRRGENAAFKKLYDAYNKAMFNVCLRMLNNKQEAEDVLQESFISAFKNIQQYSAKASFGSWLKRIVINRCIDSLKKRSLDLIPLAERDLPEEEPSEEADITFSVEAIKEAISRLADGYRVIVSLYLFEEHSHKMIAEKLDISEGTSKSQYARAKKKLIEMINLKNNGS